MGILEKMIKFGNKRERPFYKKIKIVQLSICDELKLESV